VDRCPITKEECGLEKCILWMRLSDYAGCPFDLADQAIQDFKQNTLLPAARKLDELVRNYLQSGGKRR
jgi:hypothetical protein